MDTNRHESFLKGDGSVTVGEEIAHGRDCSAKDCNNRALWIPFVRVWAKGHPKTSTPLEVEIGMQFCSEHREAFKVGDIPELPGLIKRICASLKAAEPDVDSAQVVTKPLITA